MIMRPRGDLKLLRPPDGYSHKENPRILLPYDQLEIIRGDYDGKQVCYYCYKTPQAGELRLNFNADGSISSKFNLNEEMKSLAEKFMSL